jgi:hypothetical protein
MDVGLLKKDVYKTYQEKYFKRNKQLNQEFNKNILL